MGATRADINRRAARGSDQFEPIRTVCSFVIISTSIAFRDIKPPPLDSFR